MKYNASVKFPTLKELWGFITEAFVITERFVSPLLHCILVYTIQTQTYERNRVKINSTQQFLLSTFGRFLSVTSEKSMDN
jgi:hypothetical protein